MSRLMALISFLAAMFVAGAAGADPVYAERFDARDNGCDALQQGRWRNVRNRAMRGVPFYTDPLHVATREGCDATYEKRESCGLPVVNGVGTSEVRVNCGDHPTPSNGDGGSHVRVHDRLIIDCRAGLIPTEHGCALRGDLPQNYNWAIVRLSQTNASGYMVDRLRVSRHAVQESYMAVGFENGTPVPANGSTCDPTLCQQMDTFLRGRAARDAETDRRLTALENNDFRLHFEGGLVGLGHWNAGSPVGALGGGGALQAALVLDWPEAQLRIYGGWGLGVQSNTPYHMPGPDDQPVEASPVIHHGRVGIDVLFPASERVLPIVGIDGFIAGRTGPAIFPGDISSLLALRINVHAGASFILAGASRGAQLALNATVNVGYSEIYASTGMRLFGPTTVGLGGELGLVFRPR